MFRRLFKDLYAYRDLLFAMTSRDITVRYKQAIMGVAWAFFLPLLAVVSGVVIRVAMAHLSGQSMPPLSEVTEVMVRSVLWLLFASAVGGSAVSLIANLGLVTKIYFPREILPLSNMLGRLFDFGVSVVGVVIVIAIMAMLPNDSTAAATTSTVQTSSPMVVSWYLFMLIPLVLLVTLMTTGLGLVLATANVFFRDVKYIVEVLLRFGIFFSGVIVFAKDLPVTAAKILMLNPLVPLMEATSSVVVRGTIEPMLWPWLIYSAGWTALLCLVGLACFQKGEHLFAEYA